MDGSTHVVLDPLTFLSRLAALVPPPRRHLVTYHGAFAPAAIGRDGVVRKTLPKTRGGGCGRHAGGGGVEGAPDAERATDRSGESSPWSERRYSWAELMRRVFAVDVLVCDRCGGRRELLEFILRRDAIEKILTHLGLPTEAPSVAPARAPPEQRGLGEDDYAE